MDAFETYQILSKFNAVLDVVCQQLNRKDFWYITKQDIKNAKSFTNIGDDFWMHCVQDILKANFLNQFISSIKPMVDALNPNQEE